MGFPRPEYWSGVSFPPPGDLPGIEPISPALKVIFLPSVFLKKKKKLAFFSYLVPLSAKRTSNGVDGIELRISPWEGKCCYRPLEVKDSSVQFSSDSHCLGTQDERPF